MTTLLLIRHADNDLLAQHRLAGRQVGIHLNENGQAQARALAECLAKFPIKSIYSSPLERCIETAAPIADSLKLNVITREGLNEVHFGSWQNRTIKQVHRLKLWQTIQNKPSMVQFPDGERFTEAQARISDELRLISTSHKPKEMVACFSHSDMIKLGVAFFIGLPLDRFQVLTIFPASITTLHLDGTQARLIHLNQLLIPNAEH